MQDRPPGRDKWRSVPDVREGEKINPSNVWVFLSLSLIETDRHTDRQTATLSPLAVCPLRGGLSAMFRICSYFAN
jgi:hypothetical protein